LAGVFIRPSGQYAGGIVTQIDPLMLLRAYGIGVFPMSHAADDPEIFWVEPRRRAILPLDGFHLSHSLRKFIRSGRFRVTADTAFAMGHAHSVEVWADERLVGGLYGISLGRAFFGESMFSRTDNASKVALAWLVARLRVGGYRLLDCQFLTSHLASLGAIEISARDYSGLLSAAVAGAAPGLPDESAGDFAALDRLPDLAPLSTALTVSGPVSGQTIVQLLTQTS
jgi:leucyl/phenylalanyl-tRNA--protein transferase